MIVVNCQFEGTQSDMLTVNFFDIGVIYDGHITRA